LFCHEVPVLLFSPFPIPNQSVKIIQCSIFGSSGGFPAKYGIRSFIFEINHESCAECIALRDPLMRRPIATCRTARPPKTANGKGLPRACSSFWEIMMGLAKSTVTGKWTRNSHRELEKK
jgi:hypothetical protein